MPYSLYSCAYFRAGRNLSMVWLIYAFQILLLSIFYCAQFVHGIGSAVLNLFLQWLIYALQILVLCIFYSCAQFVSAMANLCLTDFSPVHILQLCSICPWYM